MARRPFEFRFGVGKPDGNHSMIWKVWGGRKMAEGGSRHYIRWDGGTSARTRHHAGIPISISNGGIAAIPTQPIRFGQGGRLVALRSRGAGPRSRAALFAL